MASRRDLSMRPMHRRSTLVVHAREAATPPALPFTPYLAFAFFNAFFLVFEFQLVVPTAQQYVEALNVDARLSGLLIGCNQFGTAVLQLPVLLLLWLVPIKWALVLLVALMGVGNLLYALALPLRSVTLLFAGRLLCSTTSGLQIGNSVIDMELDDPQLEFTASRYISFLYELGSVAAYVLAAFYMLVLTPSFGSGIVVNVATICGYTSFGACVLFLLAMLTTLSPRKRLRETPAATTRAPSPRSAILGVLFMFVLNAMEVLRQVTLFQLFGRRWVFDGALDNMPAMALLAAFVFVGVLVTFPLDALFKPTPTGILPAFAGAAVSYLLVLPYPTHTTASVLLQAFGGVLFAFFQRSCFAYANFLVLRYVKKSPHRRLLLALNSMAMSCGIAMGATCATLFDLSAVPHMALLVAAVALIALVPRT